MTSSFTTVEVKSARMTIHPGDSMRFGPHPKWYQIAWQWFRWRVLRGPEPHWTARKVTCVSGDTITIDRSSAGPVPGHGYHRPGKRRG